MTDSIESSIVSRRRIQFEAGGQDTKQLSQQNKSHERPQQHQSIVQFQSPHRNVLTLPALQSELMQHDRVLSSVETANAPNSLGKESSPALARPSADFAKKEAGFTDFTGCFTDDGSPLIEQQGLSEPLLKRDRHLNPGHPAPAVAALSPHGFSLASQQLLIQQQQLLQQVNQQQQHIHKLNVSLQDAATSRGSYNQHAPSTPSNGRVDPPEAHPSPQLRPENASQLEEAMRHFLQFREASLKKMHLLEQENASLKSQLQTQVPKSDLQQQPVGIATMHDLERRLTDMKMSHDQQILDLQKHHAIENNRSFAQGMEVGQQKLMSALAVAQSQIVELRNAAMEKDRALIQLQKDAQHTAVAQTIQELSDTNASMSAQFGYREKYWLQELNAAKASLADADSQKEQMQLTVDALQIKQRTLESNLSRLLHIRQCLVSKFVSALRIFHLRRAFDDWNRSIENIRVERMLETPQEFVRSKNPVSLPLSSASDSMQHRLVASADKGTVNANVSRSETGINASAVAATSLASSSVSNFLQGLWASSISDTSDVAVSGSDRAHYPGVPPSLISDVLAPLSFGAEPKSWPLQRLDQDLVNAAFQLVPTDVSASRVSAIGPDSSESRQLSGPKRAPSRAIHSSNQGDVAEFHV